MPASRPVARTALGSMGLCALFTALLDGCLFGHSSCEDAGPPTPFEHTFETSASRAQIEDHTRSDGTIDCSVFCTAEEVLGCTDLGPDAGGGGAGGDGGGMAGGGGAGGGGVAGGGGAGEEDVFHTIECRTRGFAACEGRRHAAVDADRSGVGPDEIAAWLLAAARSEAASVPAFRVLRDELERLRAPQDLLRAAASSERDERRHTMVMSRLAREAGATQPVAVPPSRPIERTLFELALENAVEGCVHECFAALVAMHQARHAGSPEIRRAMGTIAADELRHGELAWSIHRWACAELSPAEVAAIGGAMRAAAGALVESLRVEPCSPPARRALGLPPAGRAVALAEGVRARLWS
jgi:hypothetical protein